MEKQKMNLDETDRAILKCLQVDGRMQIKDIAEVVHLSGPAVGTRINRMKENGLIQGFTVRLDEDLFATRTRSTVTLYMNDSLHEPLQKFIKSELVIQEAHKISGPGCYLMQVETESYEELEKFLESLSAYGRYQVSLSLRQIK